MTKEERIKKRYNAEKVIFIFYSIKSEEAKIMHINRP